MTTKLGYPALSEAEAPVRKFSDRAEAQAAADAITNTPRRGKARVQFSAYYNAYMVEVHPRGNPYGNPAVLRENGKVARHVLVDGATA